jgi:putative hydroxymethylpyrimidine transport system substrate-binding protein
MTRRLSLAAAVFVLVAGLAACGSKSDDSSRAPRAQRLSLLLDFQPNPDHVGIYAAQARGDFKRAGLDVSIRTPGDAATPLTLLQTGKTDLAISYEPELLLARDKGARLVAIAALAQSPLTSVMSVAGAHVSSVRDLDGKTVGTAGIAYQSAYLKTILANASVDASKVKEVNVGFDLVRAMISKKVDATLGAYWNVEGVQLAQQHKAPKIIRVEQAGVPTYNELVIVARETWLQKHGALVRRFIQALQAGTRAVEADPASGVDALVAATPGLDRKFAEASVKATLPVLVPASDSKPFGWMEPTEWQSFSQWMLQNKLVSRLPTDAALTNEFLPGQGAVSGDSDTP